MKLLPNHITVWYKFSYKLTWISDMIVNDYTTENIEVLMYIHKLYFILYLIDLFTPNFQYKKWTSARVRAAWRLKLAIFLWNDAMGSLLLLKNWKTILDFWCDLFLHLWGKKTLAHLITLSATSLPQITQKSLFCLKDQIYEYGLVYHKACVGLCSDLPSFLWIGHGKLHKMGKKHKKSSSLVLAAYIVAE